MLATLKRGKWCFRCCWWSVGMYEIDEWVDKSMATFSFLLGIAIEISNAWAFVDISRIIRERNSYQVACEVGDEGCWYGNYPLVDRMLELLAVFCARVLQVAGKSVQLAVAKGQNDFFFVFLGNLLHVFFSALTFMYIQ